MQLADYLDVNALEDAIDAGYIRVFEHHSLPLVGYSYTEKAQFDAAWSDEARKCRGLVVDQINYSIVAHCMPKFFNYSEHANGKAYAPLLPNLPFKIYAKMDGSLGTVFYYSGQWHVATRGSFHSDQAEWATKYLRSKISPGVLDTGLNYVAEIIYPDNRIVVNYGTREDLVLLTAFNVAWGEEVLEEGAMLEWGWVGSVVPEFEPRSLSIDELQYLAEENLQIGDHEDQDTDGTEGEGYVVKFQDGTRVKVKFSDYLRLHKILTHCNARSIWEALKNGSSIENFLTGVPDEFQDWVLKVRETLGREFDSLKSSMLSSYEKISHLKADRKAFAAEAVKTKYKSAMFLLLDGREERLNDFIWTSIKPEADKPFRDTADV